MQANYIIPFHAHTFFTHFVMAFIPRFQRAIGNWQLANPHEASGFNTKLETLEVATTSTGDISNRQPAIGNWQWATLFKGPNCFSEAFQFVAQ